MCRHVSRSGAKIPIDTKFDYITEAATKQGDCINPAVNRVVRRISGKTQRKSKMTFDAEFF